MQTARSQTHSLNGSRPSENSLQATSIAPDIVALGQPLTVGPWRITVAEVRTSAEAAAQVQEANPNNASAPDGLEYLTAWMKAQSMSDRPLAINLSDFAATGADGVLRRPPTIDMPEPALQGVVEPGGSLEGWIPFLVDDPATTTLWLDSPFTGGNWADAIFALSETAAVFATPTGDAADTSAGADPSRPVAIGETVRTGGWDVTVEEVIFEQEVIDRADFRLQALGLNGVLEGGSVVGVRVSVTNLSPYPAFFSTSALAITGLDGDPWDHTVTLTPPNPDVSQEYLPGGSGGGWAAFEIADFASPDLIRILPFHIGGSPRYFSFTGGLLAAEADSDAATAVPQDFGAGDTVVIAEESVNLRAEPSSTGEIVTQLVKGTELVITGDEQEADGYVWYPVEVTGTGETGFVAQDFIEADE